MGVNIRIINKIAEKKVSFIEKRLAPVRGNRHGEPAVNRQPGFRRGTRRAVDEQLSRKINIINNQNGTTSKCSSINNKKMCDNHGHNGTMKEKIVVVIFENK